MSRSVLAGLSTLALCSTVAAQTATQFPVATLPEPDLLPAGSVRAADVDGDGRLDIGSAVVTSFRLRLGQLDGSFGPAIVSPGPPVLGGGTPSTMRFADADLDGMLDAFGNVSGEFRPAGSFATFDRFGSRKGAGDGSFGPLLGALRNRAYRNAVLDLNHDGLPDVLVGEAGFGPSGGIGKGVRVCLGEPDGSLTEVQFLPNVLTLVLGDVDGDGSTDLLSPLVSDGTQWLYPGRRDGTFGTPITPFAAPTSFLSGVLRDFDRDGDDDAALVSSSSSPVDLALRVYRAAPGQPPLTLLQELEAPPGVTSGADITAGDVNGDGQDDLVVASSEPGLVWFAGRPDGTFEEAVVTPTGRRHSDPQVVDLDRDGHADVLTAAGKGSQSPGLESLAMVRGGIDGPASVVVSSVGVEPDVSLVDEDLILADVDGDGHQDLLGVQDDPALNLWLAPANPDGSFAPAVALLPGESAHELAAGDVDGDGLSDLIVGLDDRVVLLRADAVAGFLPAETLADTASVVVRLADLNGDTWLDAVWGVAQPPSLIWREGHHDGSFGAAVSLPLPAAPRVLTSGDVDGDGLDDLVASLPASAAVACWLGRVGGPLPAIEIALDAQPLDLALVDLDGAGALELAVTQRQPDGLQIVRDLAGVAEVMPRMAFSQRPAEVVAADFGRDGRADLLVSYHQGAAPLLLLKGDGAGHVSAALNFDAGIAPRVLLPVDANHDGWLDVVVANHKADSVVLLPNRGGPIADLAFDHAPAGIALPRLDAQGELVPDAAVTFDVTHVDAPSVGVLVVGTDTAFARLTSGGVLVPSVQGLLTWPDGPTLVSRWPAGVEAGAGLYVQGVFASPAGPRLTNALLLAP